MKCISVLVLALLAVLVSVAHGYNNAVPVIGILTLPCDSSFNRLGCKSSYINSDYVKWVEAAGGKSVAIPYNATPQQIRTMMGSLNGVIFTGGNHDLDNRYLRRSYETIYSYAKDSFDQGVPVPIWGTCLGFEALMLLASGYNKNTLSVYNSSYVSLPVKWADDAASAKMFDYLSEGSKKELMDYLAVANSTVNIHRYGFHPKTYDRSAQLQEMYRVVGTSVDLNGKPFITMFEGNKYPFFASQYHPERVAGQIGENMLQTYDNTRAMHHFGAAFVEKARANIPHRSFSSERELIKSLVFNSPIVYVAAKTPGSDLQFYMF